jgi:hypothetical protein
VRSAGNSVDYHEASTEAVFAIGPITPEPARVNSVHLAPDKTSPQRVGSTISFRAVSTGGAAPLQYKWFLYDGSAWTQSGTWTTSGTYAWTPTTANRNYRIGVWVRSHGNSLDYHEASTEIGFVIDGAATPSAGPVTSVTLSADRVTPQPVNTPITWRATTTGGTAPHQYKWFVFDGSNWIVQADWSQSNTFVWRPTVASANYRIAVWVRSAGNSVDYHERAAETGYAIRPR